MVSIEWLPLTLKFAEEMHRLKRGEDFVDLIDPALHVQLQSPRRKTLAGVHAGSAVAELDCEILGDAVWFSVWVAPNLRRKGVGLAAMQHLQAWTKQQGCARLVGAVEPMNTPSRRLMERAGFTVSAKPDEEDGMLRAELVLA